MLTQALTVLGVLGLASSRETHRPVPTITNSLVNLGSMDISFHFNGRDVPSPISNKLSSSSFSFPKSEAVIEECPCSAFSKSKNSPFLTNPTSFINKILSSNDLTSFNKDSMTSHYCCDSHEEVQEGTFVFEIVPNQKPANPLRSSSIPMLPFIFDSVIPTKSKLPPMKKTKNLEIFLLPKKNDMLSMDFSRKKPTLLTRDLNKDNIQVVGKDLKNKNLDLYTPPPPNTIKKDLTAQEIKEKEKENKQEKVLDKQETNKLTELANKANIL